MYTKTTRDIMIGYSSAVFTICCSVRVYRNWAKWNVTVVGQREPFPSDREQPLLNGLTYRRQRNVLCADMIRTATDGCPAVVYTQMIQESIPLRAHARNSAAKTVTKFLRTRELFILAMRAWSYAWFPALRFRSSVSISVTVSVKPCPYCRSVTPFRKRRCCSRHIGEWPAWRSRLAGEYPALPSGRSSRPRRNGNGENRTRSYMNGSTATANLRKGRTLCFMYSYGILTEFLRRNVILTQRSTGCGYGSTET